MDKSDYTPKWIQEKYKKIAENPELSTKCDEITDFIVLIDCIWRISNRDYQTRNWVNHEDPQIIDSYDDTLLYFREDGEPIVYDPSDVQITQEQYDSLRKLYDQVTDYDMRNDRPDTDAEIVEDPDWAKIREFAKEVYSKLTA